MKKISFRLATLGRTLHTDDVDRITVMTQSGEITLLPGHIPIITVIVPGELVLQIGEHIQRFFIGQGVLTLDDTGCTILTNNTELPDDIARDIAQSAISRARELMESISDKSDVEYARLQAQIERDLARVRVRNKWDTERR